MPTELPPVESQPTGSAAHQHLLWLFNLAPTAVLRMDREIARRYAQSTALAYSHLATVYWLQPLLRGVGKKVIV